MIDSHCHLTDRAFNNDRTDVLLRARTAGVAWIINPGTDVEQSRAAVTLAETEADVCAAVGVHPHDAGSLTENTWKKFEIWARHPRVVAIGEVGLERSDRSPDLALQERVLETFVALAESVRKPLIFHVRNAHEEFRRFLEAVGEPVAGVVHCFSGTMEDARAYMEHGLFVSITGIVTFPNADDVRAVVREIPLERILVETDSPYLAPQAMRGKRNEPAYVVEVIREIARLHGRAQSEVDAITQENARSLFRL